MSGDQTKPTDSGAAPAYLQHADIRAMFHWLLDRLDNQAADLRTRTLSRRVNAENFPALFGLARPDDEYVLWQLLQRCQSDGLLRIQADKKRRDPHRSPWEGMRIVFDLESAAHLRQWLDRPLISPETRRWRLALAARVHDFCHSELLAQPLFAELGQPAEEIIARLAAIPVLLAERPLSTYQISARLFWGHSKLLKGKEQWLCELLGLPESAILARMLPVEVAFPSESPSGILMLENLDSYFSACNGNWPDCDRLIKLYTQGFRGAAARIRNPACARLHFADQGLPSPARLDAFRAAWFQGAAFAWPVYFCGDMDWSGLAIFRALQPVFPGIQPWRIGYEIMLQAARQGGGHAGAMAGKINQLPLDTSGDAWLDTHVLSFLKTHQRFVDQEVIG
jgi:hypothetical protein